MLDLKKSDSLILDALRRQASATLAQVTRARKQRDPSDDRTDCHGNRITERHLTDLLTRGLVTVDLATDGETQLWSIVSPPEQVLAFLDTTEAVSVAGMAALCSLDETDTRDYLLSLVAKGQALLVPPIGSLPEMYLRARS